MFIGHYMDKLRGSLKVKVSVNRSENTLRFPWIAGEPPLATINNCSVQKIIE